MNNRKSQFKLKSRMMSLISTSVFFNQKLKMCIYNILILHQMLDDRMQMLNI